MLVLGALHGGAAAQPSRSLTPTAVPGAPVTLPPVTLPPVTLPPAGGSTVTSPELAPVTVPPVTLPPVTIPPVTVPPVTVPEARVPAPPRPSLDAPLPAGGGAGARPPVTDTPQEAPTTVPAEGPLPLPPGSRAGEDAEQGSGDDGGGADRSEGPLVTRLRQAAARTIEQLSFPIGLAMAMLGFLVVQHRVDHHDARLADPTLGADDEYVGFS